jgi:RHS repeat-associated protein
VTRNCHLIVQQTRILTVKDALSNMTSYAYAMSTDRSTSTLTTTNALSQVSTEVDDRRWGVAETETDPNGNITTGKYDALGRRTGEWLPDNPWSSTTQASIGYSYMMPVDANGNVTGPDVIETSTLSAIAIDNTYALFDGLGRLIQTQKPADGGGFVVSDTDYNTLGQTDQTNNNYWAASGGGGALFVPSSQSTIPSQNFYLYDGAGRQVSSTLESYGAIVSTSTAAYPGTDRTDQTPPSGGTPTSTYVNSLGETTELVQYLASSVSATAPTETTTYSYDAAGDRVGMTDPDGNQWTWTFNELGQQTSAVDPDTGKSTATYDADGNLQTSTDARGIELYYSYDVLNRKTGVYQGSSSSGSELDSWNYDTKLVNGVKSALTNGIGQVTSSTSYVASTPGHPGLAYTQTMNSFNALYEPTSVTTSIPVGAPAFANTSYTTTMAYNTDGSSASTTDPAEGGLAQEVIRQGYDAVGNPASLSGANSYAAVSYTPLSQVAQIERNSSTGTSLYSDYGWDAATGRLDQIQDMTLNGTTTHVAMNDAYSYDPDGNVASIEQTSDTLATQTQCFQYDYLQDLTQAWTPSDSTCGTGPSSSDIGGAAPYWDTYQVDEATGNRTAVDQHATSSSGADAISTYYYPTAGSPQPHAVGSVQQIAGGNSSTANYGYDADGDTTSRPGETITYDAQGRVQSVTASGGETQSNLYDASGNLLLQSDSTTGSTLFLGDTELHETQGSTTASALRTYSVGPTPVAERSTAVGTSGSLLVWAAANEQGTVELEIAPTTGSLQARYFDPFGQDLLSPTGFTDDRGFLNASTSTLSGLVELGARVYDPSIGRFLSVDSILAPFDPQQNNGYSYAHNSPITQSDPSGLLTEPDPSGSDSSGGDPCGDDQCMGGNAPPAGNTGGGQDATQAKALNLSEKYGSWVQHPNAAERAALWLAGVTVGNDGNLRTNGLSLQLLGGYSNWLDDQFKKYTEAKPESFQFTYGGTKYVLWMWKGEYLNWGDGDEVGLYAQNNSPLDRIEGWNADPFDSNLPKMSVSLSVGGRKLGSFDPQQSQDWVGLYDPAATDTNIADIHATISVTFPSKGMYTAFINSPSVKSQLLEGPKSLITPDADDNKATINF